MSLVRFKFDPARKHYKSDYNRLQRNIQYEWEEWSRKDEFQHVFNKYEDFCLSEYYQLLQFKDTRKVLIEFFKDLYERD